MLLLAVRWVLEVYHMLSSPVHRKLHFKKTGSSQNSGKKEKETRKQCQQLKSQFNERGEKSFLIDIYWLADWCQETLIDIEWCYMILEMMDFKFCHLLANYFLVCNHFQQVNHGFAQSMCHFIVKVPIKSSQIFLKLGQIYSQISSPAIFQELQN